MSKQWWENDPIASEGAEAGAEKWWENDPVAGEQTSQQTKAKNTQQNRSVSADVGKSVAGSVISAIGSIPTAGGRLIREGGELLLGLSMDEARTLAEAEGKPEKAQDYYNRSNMLNPVSKLGGVIESAGGWLAEKGDQVRDSRSVQAKELARQSTPEGDLTKPSTWTMGQSPSVEGTAHVMSDVVGSLAPQVATAVATRGKSASTQVTAGGVVGASQIGGAAIQEANEYLSGFSDDKLREASPVFRQLEAKGYSAEDARKIIIRDAENRAASYAAPVGFVGGQATGAILGKAGERVASGVKGIGGRAAVLGALGATEEGIQEVGEGVATRSGINDATGTQRSLTEGTFPEFVLGAAGGGAAGAGKGVLQGVGERMQSNQDANTPPDSNSPATPPTSQPTYQGSAGQSMGTADTTEATKALLEPKSLTALDRANEIDSELTRITERAQELTPENGYGPAFDQERAELASQAQELAAERAGIAQSWPKAKRGAPTSFSTEAGARLDGEYALMDASDLVTSHDENLRSNPLYPAELQPRDRSRQASELQVSGIVQKLDPARLGVSADAATGAPIVGVDGLVESGNARTIALKRVYQANGQKATDYKQFLRDNAAQFGITPESVDSMQKPVLVRVRNTPVNRAEFARQANASTVQRMSASEQALSDAKRLGSIEGLNPDDNGEFKNSYDFIRQFMGMLPVTEQSDMLETDGQLSTFGYRRIQNAVLAKAFGDSSTLRRMTESMDDNLRNITKALTRVAPMIAAARDRMQAGTMYDADIAPDLVQAVEGLSAIKDKGWSVADELGQNDLTGPKYSPEAAQLLTFLSDNIRSPRRIAEFMQRYYEALERSGDPSQGSMFGDEGPAPTRTGLLNTAQGNQDDATDNTQRGIDRQDPAPNAQDGGQREDAPRGGSRDQGDGTARTDADGRQSAQQNGQGATGEWVAFPPESGTLGIPRREMPQVKSEHRGALINFLDARGVGHEQDTVSPDTLKPTQAEFSRDKVAKFTETGVIGGRSVLVSSDGYVLDGHHQWMGHQALNEDIPVIRLDAKIKELLAIVNEFPSTKRSEGGMDEARAAAVADFKDAMADLAEIATRHTKMYMVDPGKVPNLMPTLVKLFESAIKIVGTDLKAATKWVKEQLKADERTRKFWNKIGNDTYQKAAMQALDGMDKPAQRGLFDTPEAATEAVQRGLFDEPVAQPAKAEKPKVAMINGKPYDIASDNYKPKDPPEFLTPELLKKANDFIEKFYKGKQEFDISAQERAKGEKLLAPRLKLAEDAKAEYDQKIIDIAKKTKALGQMLAPIKGAKRAVEKMKQDQIEKGAAEMDPTDVKDLLRSTIVTNSYADVDRILLEIDKSFNVARIKDKTTVDMRERNGGYSDVTVFVKMENGIDAEIQINIPSMIAIKEHQGHKLYEAARDLPAASQKKAEIYSAMREIYDAAFALSATKASTPPLANARDLAAQAKNAASDMGEPDRGPAASMPGSGTKLAPSSDALNQRPSGNLTNSEPSKLDTNSQPVGNLSGSFIGSPLDSNVPQIPINGYTGEKLSENNDANNRTGKGSDQGQGAGATQATERQGRAQQVRGGSGRAYRQPGGDADASPASQAEVGQAGAGGVRGTDENRRSVEPGAGAGRNAGVPAGRDIPPKSGRNYAFGPDDLTYQGSWFKKAEQNVEAIELLKKLDTEGRQATREEQSLLAKFNGWGASEVANNLFGKKLDKAADSLRAYNEAVKQMDALNRDHLNKGGQYRGHYADNGYYQAASVLRDAGKLGPHDFPMKITRAELDAAKPDNSTRKWIELRDRMKAAMTEQEFAEASRSTQYAHYTSKEVVRAMWQAMDRMGFKGGSVLEPGAGIGVFPGLMPQGMAANSIYTGIEYDSIAGRILKQLFPDERILVESFVDSKLPKNFYDVAAGNPPFSGTKILGDPEYAKRALSLHDYFFAKSIDRVKPGGLVMYVTSRYTLDKLDDKARKYLAERADLVGAIRMPQTAFKQNAGTEVVTDVIFLRKKVKGETFEYAQPWLGVSEVKDANGKTLMIGDSNGKAEKPALINEYFAAHPEMVLGNHANTGSMYKDKDYTVTPLDGDIESHFAKAVENLPEGIYKADRGSSAEAAKVREIDFNPKAKKEGNYYVTDAGQLMVREGGVGQRVELKSQKDVQLIKDFVPLRDTLKQAHYDQLNNGEWEISLKALQKAYADFTKKNGQINQFTTKVVKTKATDEETGETYTDETMVRAFPLLEKLRNDPDYTLVAALESVNDDTGEITPSSFLSERVLGKADPAAVNTPIDALLSSLNDVGHVDIPLISQRVGLSEADTIEALGTSIYEDPEAGWVTADEYLSGNVKRKLDAARESSKADKRFERNIQALEAVQPAPKTPSQINVTIGMNWVPGEVYAKFLKDLANVTATVEWNERTKQWLVDEKAGGKSMQATVDWGTAERNVTALMETALTGRQIRITKSEGYGKDKVTSFDAAATEAANQKLTALRERFASWVWEDAGRTDTMVKLYNDKFNTTVPRAFDGRHLTLPGMSKSFSVFDHVKRGAWRIIQRGNTYLAHAVGSGKTFQMVISAMEQKRLGLIKKPMMVVPNHMLKQFAHEWQMLYPAARLMVADENNFHTDNRRRFVSRVALSDLDGVIITHSAFKLLDLDPEFKTKMIEEQLEFMRAALEEAGGKVDDKGKSKDPKIKQIEKQIENFEQKLEAALSSAGKDKNVRFDELGVDMLYVDEAHEFRKLDFTTNRKVKNINPEGSARSFDLYMKSRYLEEKNPGRSLVMASGTPVTNTLAELYTVQKFMDRQALVDKGIEDFDSWASMFGRERTVLEPNAAGKYEPVTRFSKFVNVSELTQMFREFADVLTSDNLAALLGDKRPKVIGGSRKITVTPKTDEYASYQKELAARVDLSREWKPTPGEPNNPDPIIKIIGDGRLAAIDMRFVRPSLPSDPDSKLNRMIDDVIKAMDESKDMEYRDKAGNVEPNKGAAMMVFSDLGFGAGVAANRGFNARAWFEKRLRDAGIPMSQVAFMSDYKKSADKLKLFKDVNAGRVRLLIGSSKNMGTGVNAQQRLLHLFHLDSPWYPADLEQREGRIVRQGNKNPLVNVNAYAAKGSYDENMWKMLASKQFFIDQALSGDENMRELEDLDNQSQYDLAAAMVAEDPRILQLAGIRAEIEKLQRLYRAHEDQRARFKGQYEMASSTVSFNEKRMPEAEADAKKVQDLSGNKFKAKVGGKTFDDRGEWGEALIAKFKDMSARAESKPVTIGEISGFPVVFGAETFGSLYIPKVVLATPSPTELITDAGTSPVGVAMRAQNAVTDVARLPAKLRERITEAKAQIDALSTRLETPFPMSGMLADKVKEASDLESEIESDGKAKAAAKAAANDQDQDQEQQPGEEIRLARGAGTNGMDIKELDALVTRAKAKMPNMPKVHVLKDPSTAPKALRDYITLQGAWGDVEGAIHNGELYMFASGLSDPLRAEHVLVEHEAAHYGLRAILGPSLKTAMNLIYANNPKVRQAATELQKRGKLSNVEAVEEVIVDMPASELVKLKGWRQVVRMMAEYLGNMGFELTSKKLTEWLDGSLSDQERADLFVDELVQGARDFVAGKYARGRPGNYVGITRLSKFLSEDIAVQEKWLTQEAKARGYANIDELVDANYELFEKLAKLWRDKNPAESGVLLSRAEDNKTDTPAFKKWFGDSKVVDAEGKPLVVYHGTRKDFDQFSNKPPFFFATKPLDASSRAIMNDGRPFGANVMPVYLRANNPFDYNNTAHIESVLNEMEASGRIYDDRDRANKRERLIGSVGSNWDAIESKDVQSAIKKLGFDAFYVKEYGGRNIAVYDPRQIKSATGNNGSFDPANPDIRFSRAAPKKTTSERADEILANAVSRRAPLDVLSKGLARITGIERMTSGIYDSAANLLNRLPEHVKAGIVSDYGVPEAVIDQRVMLQGRQRVQLRKAGELIDKLSTLTREESRVAYEWMNMDGQDPKAYMSMMQGLPEESVKVLTDVQKMIDQLSKEAVRLGQLSPDAYERNKFAYLRRSYAKHIMEQTNGEKAKRARVISILGDQYKGRGLSESAPMEKIKATDWWKRKDTKGQADAALKGETFVRLEYRTHKQSGVAVRTYPSGKTKAYYTTRNAPFDSKTGQIPGLEVPANETTLKDVVYWPAKEPIPKQYAEYDKAGTWEVRDVKGPNAIFWRDFTKDERETMGEVDEARFAIAKTLHGMIHDVEVGRYLEWMAVNQAKPAGSTITGTLVDASERMRDTFAPGEWVQVPDTKIQGTGVAKYGKLAGKYLPGPVWNDLRQTVNGQFKPFGETYSKILGLWKTSKTALSPGVHMNNVMSNFVMADFHDVGAAHVAKSLRIILAASKREGNGVLGRVGNVVARGGIADREAAREILNRYADSGGDIGSWATNEIAQGQLEPLLESMEKELQATAGNSVQAQTGVFSALQHAMMLRFPSAWEAFKPTLPGRVVATEAKNLIDLYQHEDDVFRLAAWLKAKEEGASDVDAGKRSRKSFLDYSINAPWIQAMRQSAWPFISFTYRAVPMLAEVAGKKPHKLLKLMMVLGTLNALGSMLAGGDDDEERKLLPEEKAGKIWGVVPKLIRMPWNDDHGSAVYLDIRRFIPVGDVFDVGAGQSAIPVLPGLMPGGPLVLAGEVVLNKSAFTGKSITLETDTATQQAAKVADHLYKAFAPNILGLPNTYATTGVVEAAQGKTDAFGREQSVAQAVASSFGVKLGSYPADVLRRNLNAKAQAEMMEIQKNISQLKRQRQTNRIDPDEFREAVEVEQNKMREIMRELREKTQ